MEESIIRSGYPMLTEVPEDLEEECAEVIMEGTRVSSHFKRAVKLGNTPAGSGHCNYLKGIIVQMDITAPQYFWQQAQRYHWFDIVSSQSKMHKILEMDLDKQKHIDPTSLGVAKAWIEMYKTDQCSFDNVLDNLPMGLEYAAGITTNYLQLKCIWNQRHNHRLSAWKSVFCPWVESLPYAKELGVCGGSSNN